jgi:hypothetical protein
MLQTRINYAQAKKGQWGGGPIPYGMDLHVFAPDRTFLYKVVEMRRRDGEHKRLKSDADGKQTPYNGEGNCVPKDKKAECYLFPSEHDERLNDVRLIFDWCAREGMPYTGICDELERLGRRTLSGKRWSPSTISKMLRNTMYIGRVTQLATLGGRYTDRDEDGHVITVHRQNPTRRKVEPVISDQYFDPVVPVEQFNGVQAFLNGRWPAVENLIQAL